MPAGSPSPARPEKIPLRQRLGQLALIFVGTTTTVSALVNGVAAWWLIESSDEESLGITRFEVLVWCALIFVFGALLLFFGIRSWRSTRSIPQK